MEADVEPGPVEPRPDPWRHLDFLRPFPQAWHVAVMAALFAVLGFLPPWVTIADHESAVNAAGIMTYYVTAHDKFETLKTSPWGALVSFLAPATIVVCTIAVIPGAAWKQKPNLATSSLAATSLLATVALLGWCSEILDPDLPTLGPFNVPGLGLTMVIMGNLTVLLAHGFQVYEDRTNPPAQTKGAAEAESTSQSETGVDDVSVDNGMRGECREPLPSDTNSLQNQ